MGSVFHQLCPRYSGTLTPTVIKLWDTFTFFFFFGRKKLCLITVEIRYNKSSGTISVDQRETTHHMSYTELKRNSRNLQMLARPLFYILNAHLYRVCMNCVRSSRDSVQSTKLCRAKLFKASLA